MMGVSGSGKSLIGVAFARALGIDFVEGDDYHSAENVQRMSREVPLTDDDRVRWLRSLAVRIRETKDAGTGLVMTCSALKRASCGSSFYEGPAPCSLNASPVGAGTSCRHPCSTANSPRSRSHRLTSTRGCVTSGNHHKISSPLSWRAHQYDA